MSSKPLTLDVTLLALYDISAAFDTVDHSILLSRLSNSFGITDRALLWFQSFLTDRTISVVFGSNRTPWVTVPYGLPQGSVLAPLLFVLYTSDLGGIFQLFGSLLINLPMIPRPFYMAQHLLLFKW